MHRRVLLTGVAGLAAGGVAGCVSGGDGGEGGTPENGTDTDGTEAGDGTETDTDGSETTPGAAVSLTDASLTPVDSECGQQRDAAEVAFDGDAGAVVVTGTIWGSDACKVPRLADASYHADADELVVLVGTKNRDTDGTIGCAQCISELDYEVAAAFDDGLPGSVTVRHTRGDDPATVTTATPT